MFAKVTIHKVKEGRLEDAKAQVSENTENAKKEGVLFVARYMMVSRSVENRVTTVTIINDKDKEPFDKYVAKAMSRATSSDSPWASIDGDEYDVVPI